MTTVPDAVFILIAYVTPVVVAGASYGLLRWRGRHNDVER